MLKLESVDYLAKPVDKKIMTTDRQTDKQTWSKVEINSESTVS